MSLYHSAPKLQYQAYGISLDCIRRAQSRRQTIQEKNVTYLVDAGTISNTCSIKLFAFHVSPQVFVHLRTIFKFVCSNQNDCEKWIVAKQQTWQQTHERLGALHFGHHRLECGSQSNSSALGNNFSHERNIGHGLWILAAWYISRHQIIQRR